MKYPKKKPFYSLNRIGSLFLQLNAYDSAMVYFQRGLDFARNTKKKDLEIGALNNLGFAELRRENFEIAIPYFEKCLRIYESLEEPNESQVFMNSLVKGNLAQCLPNSDPRKERYYLSDIEVSIDFGDYNNSVGTITEYAKLLIEMGEFDKAMKILKKGRSLVDEYQIHVKLSNILELYHQHIVLFGQLNDTKQCLLYYNIHKSLMQKATEKKSIDEHLQLHSDFELNMIQTELEPEKLRGEKKANQIKILNKDKELAKYRTGSHVVLTILLITIFTLFIVKQRNNSIKKLQERERKEQLLQSELSYNSERLDRSILSLQRKQEIIQELMERIDNFNDLKTPQKNSIKLFLINELNIDQSAIEREEDIKNIGAEFISKLRLNYPQLTESDLKMLSLIKMKLTNKQIGEIRNIATSSVKTAKNRLRKKLNIPRGGDFDSIINN